MWLSFHEGIYDDRLDPTLNKTNKQFLHQLIVLEIALMISQRYF